MIAYCFSDGVVHFGQRAPTGSITIATTPEGSDAREWKKRVQARCRLGHNGLYLVPGVPEAAAANDPLKAASALAAFTMWLRKLDGRKFTRIRSKAKTKVANA